MRTALRDARRIILKVGSALAATALPSTRCATGRGKSPNCVRMAAR